VALCRVPTVNVEPVSGRRVSILAASATPIYHTQVNLLVKMPDGNTVAMQCHYPPVWATCIEPQLTTYPAKINGHNIHLLIPVVTGKPKYNKDGTLKQPGKTGTEEVKFSFR
jgi:hypothetical protein